MNQAHQLEPIAFHESGHAVIHNYFGDDVAEIWIKGEKGNCHFKVIATDDSSDIGLFRAITACMAGKVAEDRVRGFPDDKEWRASGDYRKVWDCALRLNGGDSRGAELLLNWQEYRTAKFVEKHWRKIHKVAYALLDKGKLSGAEVRRIIEQVRAEQSMNQQQHK